MTPQPNQQEESAAIKEGVKSVLDKALHDAAHVANRADAGCVFNLSDEFRQALLWAPP